MVAQPSGIREKLNRHIKSRGGLFIFSCQILRLLGGIALFVLNFIASSKHTIPEKRLVEQDESWLQIWHPTIPSTKAGMVRLSFGAVYVSGFDFL